MPSLLDSAIAAARASGAVQRENFETELGVGEMLTYDIKLELDVRCQRLISDLLLADFPDSCVLGEEGSEGDQSAELQWIVDPIDGTVNYFYGIPHFCTSIALRRRGEIILGVIYDPMQDELFTVEKGGGARKNGKLIHVRLCRRRSSQWDFLSRRNRSGSVGNAICDWRTKCAKPGC